LDPCLYSVTCDIVLVDDEPEFAVALADILGEAGYEVEIFPTPEAAVEWLLGGGRASVVLLDLRTPGMSAQRFRALQLSAPELRDIAVVIVSGAPEIHNVAAALKANAAFVKPVDIDRLLATVKRFCVDRPASPARGRAAPSGGRRL
jgi:DNA-binding NtrC family response regulator